MLMLGSAFICAAFMPTPALPTPTPTPPLMATPTPPLTPELPERVGDLGRRASISCEFGTTHFPPASEIRCRVASSHESLFHGCTTSPSAVRACSPTLAPSLAVSTVTHPRRRDERARPKSSRRRVPRQKFSIRVYISGGLRIGSAVSPSQMMTSVSAY